MFRPLQESKKDKGGGIQRGNPQPSQTEFEADPRPGSGYGTRQKEDHSPTGARDSLTSVLGRERMEGGNEGSVGAKMTVVGTPSAGKALASDSTLENLELSKKLFAP